MKRLASGNQDGTKVFIASAYDDTWPSSFKSKAKHLYLYMLPNHTYTVAKYQ